MTVNIDSLLVNGTYYETTIYTHVDNVLQVQATLLGCDVGQDIEEEVEGSYIPAWPIEGSEVFPSDITWDRYESMNYQMVGNINSHSSVILYCSGGRYVLEGYNMYSAPAEIAEYHPTYGWLPITSRSLDDGGIAIIYENIHDGYSYAWPIVCPVPVVDELLVMYRYTHCPTEPVWSVDGVQYMANGAIYIDVDDLIYAYSVRVPQELNALIPAAMCLGIEAEFSTYDRQSVVAALASVGKKALFKEDSSCGIELVSVPLLPNQMIQFINGLDISGMGADESCGVHIHLSRKYLTQSQLGGLVVFMNHPHNLSYIEQVAGRSCNKYCKQVPGKQTTVSSDRYEMVNLTNSTTVEIRIFAGTNDKVVLRGYVEWLLSLIEWLGTNPTNYSHQSFKKYLGSHS